MNGFIKRTILLSFIQIRRLFSRGLRQRLATFLGNYLPFIERRITRLSVAANDLTDGEGIRGVSYSYFYQFNEFIELLRWYSADPVRPSIFRAAIPTLMKFIAIVCQTSAFAIMVGYLTLSTNEWQLNWQSFSFDLQPTPLNIGLFTATIFVLYSLFAAMNFFAGMMMLDIGIRYQRRLASRLLEHYHGLLQSEKSDQYISRTDMMTILNTEARYLARALIMCYNMIFQVGLIAIGAILLILLDPKMVFLASAFILISLFVQVSVIGKTLRDTRHMISLDGKNKLAISSALQKLTSDLSSLDIEKDEASQLLDVDDIRNYDISYYDRLRIGLFAALSPQIVFAVFLTGIVIVAILLVKNGGMSAALAVQYVFSLRFFVAGVTGLLIAFVSIVSYKPYFENYLDAIPLLKSKTSIPTENADFKLQSFDLTIGPSDVLFVMANQSGATWLDAKVVIKHLKNVLEFNPSINDISLVSVELLSPQNDWTKLFGCKSLDEAIARLKGLYTDNSAHLIDAIIENLQKVTQSEDGFDIAWNRLDVTEITQISMASAALADTSVIIMPERGYRAFPERIREACLRDWFGDRTLIVLLPHLPQLFLVPAPKAYIWLDYTGIKAILSQDEIRLASASLKALFAKTTLGGDAKIATVEIL